MRTQRMHIKQFKKRDKRQERERVCVLPYLRPFRLVHPMTSTASGTLQCETFRCRILSRVSTSRLTREPAEVGSCQTSYMKSKWGCSRISNPQSGIRIANNKKKKKETTNEKTRLRFLRFNVYLFPCCCCRLLSVGWGKNEQTKPIFTCSIEILRPIWWSIWIGPQQQHQPGWDWDDHQECSLDFPLSGEGHCPSQPLVGREEKEPWFHFFFFFFFSPCSTALPLLPSRSPSRTSLSATSPSSILSSPPVSFCATRAGCRSQERTAASSFTLKTSRCTPAPEVPCSRCPTVTSTRATMWGIRRQSTRHQSQTASCKDEHRPRKWPYQPPPIGFANAHVSRGVENAM